jgi:hypothetical protein
MDSPRQFVLSFSFVFFADGVSHLRLEIFDGIFDQVPTIRGLFSFQSSSERHVVFYSKSRVVRLYFGQQKCMAALKTSTHSSFRGEEENKKSREKLWTTHEGAAIIMRWILKR